MQQPERTIRGAIVVKFAVAGGLLVNAGNAIAIVMEPWRRGPETLKWLLLAEENNPSTWLTAALLLAVAATLFLFSINFQPGQKRAWQLLGVLMVALSFDEVATVHERLDDFSDTSGLLTYAWVVPALVAVCVVTALTLPLIRRLAADLRRGLVMAAALYASGGIGIEAIAGWWDSNHGASNATYHLISTLEENMELGGVVLALAALLRYASKARMGAVVHVDYQRS